MWSVSSGWCAETARKCKLACGCAGAHSAAQTGPPALMNRSDAPMTVDEKTCALLRLGVVAMAAAAADDAAVIPATTEDSIEGGGGPAIEVMTEGGRFISGMEAPSLSERGCRTAAESSLDPALNPFMSATTSFESSGNTTSDAACEYKLLTRNRCDCPPP